MRTGRCALCRSGLRGFDAAYSFGAYEGVLRELIHLYKYGKIKTLARPLSALLTQALPRDEAFDCRGAGAALLAPPVAERVQSVGPAGPRPGPAYRHSGGEGVAAFAARRPTQAGLSNQLAPPECGPGVSLAECQRESAFCWWTT